MALRGHRTQSLLRPIEILSCIIITFLIKSKSNLLYEKNKKAVILHENPRCRRCLFPFHVRRHSIQIKFKSSQATKDRALDIPTKKTEFNVKWPFKVIQGHYFEVSGKATMKTFLQHFYLEITTDLWYLYF